MKRLIGLIALGLLLAGCGSASAKTLDGYYSQTLDWRDCDDGFKCATMQVPLDYNNLAGESIDIALEMHPASKPKLRVGALVVNPGGPGGSGVDYVKAYDSQITSAVSDRYDIVGFDPRGVKNSTAIRCLDAAGLDRLLASDPTPDDAAEVKASDALTKEFEDACAKNSGELINHVSTMEVVKDLDILRALLGEDQLNYLGKSYGTVIGAVYAHEFPAKVGRFVLDGAVDMSLTSVQMSRGQAVGFDQALRRFMRYCLQTNQQCPLGSDEADAISKLTSFLNGLDAKPLKTDDPNRPLTEALGWTAVIGPMYVPMGGWDWLVDALKLGYAGDGSSLLQISDWFNARNSDGGYDDNSTDANAAVNCIDYPRTPADQPALAVEFEKDAPITGRLLAWSEGYCVNWPGKGELLKTDVSAPSANPILVIGTTYDPATPNAWAKALAAELKVGTYINFNGDGHTGYMSGSSTLDRAVDAYLLKGTLPAADSSYQPDVPMVN